ncbi:hypothethical protein (plasmid) [Ralstonia solanacearum PSI07]|nr:hypothethical protein [Ralstonia solanacearum PSI07]
MNGGAAAMPFLIGTRMEHRVGPVFRLSSIVVDVTGNKGTFVPVSKVDAMIGRRTRFLFLYF